ncbi:MAG: hypothetical protein OEY59_03325 [Deltaproteobacteria bacterium]|nr:hypothetical protein [Deltaproteobacteria bacterium]
MTTINEKTLKNREIKLFESSGKGFFLTEEFLEQSVQFYFRFFEEEYLEMERYERNYYFILDLHQELGTDFELNEEGDCAAYCLYDSDKKLLLRLVLDLGDDDLVVAYFIGNKQKAFKLRQKLFKIQTLKRCYLSSPMLMRLAERLGDVKGFEYHFSAQRPLTASSEILKGEIKGKDAPFFYDLYKNRHPDIFNLEAMSLETSGDNQLMIRLNQSGTLLAGLSSSKDVLRITQDIRKVVKQKAERIWEKRSFINHESDISKGLNVHVRFVELSFTKPLDHVERLLSGWIDGIPPLKMIGSYFRSSQTTWRVAVCEIGLGGQLEFEISREGILFVLRNKKDILPLEKIEAFLRKHVDAGLKLNLETEQA